jgi:hypothetical protein
MSTLLDFDGPSKRGRPPGLAVTKGRLGRAERYGFAYASVPVAATAVGAFAPFQNM